MLRTNLDVAVSKQILYKCSVHSGHSSMVNSKTVRQQILQLQVLSTKKKKTVQLGS